ncbi:TatD family hydrolase [Quisquiliibacterium transsilvanicum]|uniref:TatD DNase family protein n=1 Tax=Quisquiliibacterium transsilvanicum TaxID=1549638 RepID=A0A7W8HE39_9BURK|nr:TatD family hydrolase [Quisquiliibacterium transsilvanicum]MBB5270228.1 TatD DNase family protein [Quisquiliibacterium transsilvanicum]
MLIDTHCHLDAAEFDADREAVLLRARAAGVGCIVIPAVERANFEIVARIARTLPGCAYALGIHPMYVDRAGPDDLEALRAALQASIGDPRLVAIGEIGLDFFVPGLDRARQALFLDAQLKMAREFGLPVLLHVRRSQDTLLAALRRARPPGGIAHAFNGSLQQARGFLEQGFALGFGGALTYERALRIRRLVSELPADAHVLETDAPDMAPEWLYRERNEPGELPRIAQVFAGLRGVEVGEAIDATARNALRVLPRLAALLAGEQAASG